MDGRTVGLLDNYFDRGDEIVVDRPGKTSPYRLKLTTRTSRARLYTTAAAAFSCLFDKPDREVVKQNQVI